AQVRLESASNINTGAGQKLVLNGIAPSLAALRIVAAVTPAQLTTLLDAGSTGGALRIEATYSSALNLATVCDGSFYFGSPGSISYTGNTLGVGAGNVYRLGANDAAASVLTLAPATGTSPVLTGATRVLIGSLGVGGAGTVLLNQTNNYTLGTTVVRGSTL